MYTSLNTHYQHKFGCKVYKLSIDAGLTCPNRDGSIDTRGCIFCSAYGGGEFAEVTCGSVAQQLEQAKTRVSAKNKGGKYIAYFQSFSNTYAPVSRLRQLYYDAIAPEEIVGLAIGTRPDCLEPEIVELLREINKIKPVSVELGLQTIHPETARCIRRGYDLPVYEEAVDQLKARGIEVITHVILGLPGESREQMLETVRYVGGRTDGVKLQLLHVLRNTDLAKDYAAGKFRTLELEEYCDLVLDCLRVLPSHVVVHRLTGDGAKKDLIAPLWSGNKKLVLNTLNRKIKEAHLQQGERA